VAAPRSQSGNGVALLRPGMRRLLSIRFSSTNRIIRSESQRTSDFGSSINGRERRRWCASRPLGARGRKVTFPPRLDWRYVPPMTIQFATEDTYSVVLENYDD